MGWSHSLCSGHHHHCQYVPLHLLKVFICLCKNNPSLISFNSLFKTYIFFCGVLWFLKKIEALVLKAWSFSPPSCSAAKFSSLSLFFWVLKMTVEETRASSGNDFDDFPKGMRVLAVDDDPTCLKLLEGLLRKCQYHG